MRVLVTGATGFIGRHLVPALADEGHDVFGAVRDARASVAGMIAVPCDLRAMDPAALPRVEAIVHLAQANTSDPDELFAVNAGSTRALVEHAIATGVRRFVLASSGSVYGSGRGGRPFLEPDHPAGTSPYARSKIEAEDAVAAVSGSFDTSILRLFFPHGPGQSPSRLIADVAGRVRDGRPVLLSPEGDLTVNPVFVGDVTALVCRLLETRHGAVINAAGPDPITLRELAARVGGIVGREPVFGIDAAAGSGYLVGDVSAMVEILGRRPTPLDEGLRAMLGAD